MADQRLNEILQEKKIEREYLLSAFRALPNVNNNLLWSKLEIHKTVQKILASLQNSQPSYKSERTTIYVEQSSISI